MNDLRALLGDDRYDDVIERAARALSERWNSMHTNEALGRQRMLAGFTLAAVLPDLLAEANTRADEAEAKARRFANLLGNNAKALNDVLPAEVLRQKAAAWDEGYTRGFYDRERLSPDMPGRDASEGATPNPYRRGTEGTEEADR